MREQHSSSASATAFVLHVVPAAGADASGPFAVDRRLTVGRDAGCDVVVNDRGVSRTHASVEPAPGGLLVRDLNSGNGLWVDGQRVAEAVIAAGQRFRVGATTLECRLAAAAAPPPEAELADQTMVLPSPVMSAVVDAPAAGFNVKVRQGTANVPSGLSFDVTAPGATIGRSADCTIVLPDKDVSRTHARLEVTPAGFRITDLGSTCGVWIGPRRVQTATLASGDTVRIGHHIVIEIAFTGAAAPAGGMPPAPGGPARQPSPASARAGEPVAPAPAAPVPDVAPPHPAHVPAAAAAAAPAAVPHPSVAAAPALVLPPADTAAVRDSPEERGQSRVTEAGEAYATRLVEAPIDEPSLVTRLAPSPIVDETPPVSPDASGTMLLRTPTPSRAAARSIDDEGELVQVYAHQPFVLDDPASLWYVVTGGLLIFTVALDKGKPTGTRAHFLNVEADSACFGFDLQQQMYGSGFLAVPKQGTTLRRIPVARLQALAASSHDSARIAGILDTWVAGLCQALSRDLPVKRSGELVLQPDTAVELTKGHKATAGGVLWIDIWSGSIVFDDMATPLFPRKRTLFPITPAAWVQLTTDEFGTLAVTPRTTADALGDERLWHGLTVLHEVVCESEFINKKLAAADEFVRLQQKAAHSEAASEAAYNAIGSVLQSEAASPRDFLATSGAEPVLQAATLVGRAAGIEVRRHPAATDDLTYEEQVAAVATASNFCTRVVALRDEWWTGDHGPLLAQDAATKGPIALLPLSARSYELVTPSGERRKVNAAVAATVAPFAYTFYRPLPDGVITVSRLLKFGAFGLVGDLRLTVALAVVVGMFGTVTPYLTGKLFDEAIPQSERGMLFGFGLALLLSAAATSIFKFAQGVATVRIQARMESPIQAGLWYRLLNLPTNFFRQYPAGDLADRAAGVDQIQQLVAGAGISAVLGSVSGLFYVVQMFGYSLRLAILAVILTLVYVSVTTLCNYLQLRHQRVEMQLRGRLQGLVLNLISGVPKLRICGAEPHAFRVWASQFAEQKRIGFTIGNIQSAAAVFSAIFPVFSSIIIFQVLVNEITNAEPGADLITTGEFIAFNTAYMLFLMAMQSLGDASLNLLKVVPIYDRLRPILETTPEVDQSKAFPGQLTGEIELSHVNFKYSDEGPLIVNDFSLRIKPGEFVAFVGSSGCGKSTLMRLMLGFERPSSGTIYYDGQDLASLDVRMVRQQIGVVLQVSRVMPTEIYKNIIGATSRTIEDAWDAAEKAGLAEDIRNMPMGMHTYISEGGGTMSGGQRQRLMIARAIVSKPKVLFLDEATSALDNKSQAIVTESMDRMSATRIVIAHRLSTIMNADRICYLDKGRIMEMGTYQELMEKNGLFAELARRQVV
jgi:ATP-binding cassette subfamily C protein